MVLLFVVTIIWSRYTKTVFGIRFSVLFSGQEFVNFFAKSLQLTKILWKTCLSGGVFVLPFSPATM